jgi:hypothetical protein
MLHQNETLEPSVHKYFALTRKASRIIGDQEQIAPKLKAGPMDMRKLSSQVRELKNQFIAISGIFQFCSWSS